MPARVSAAVFIEGEFNHRKGAAYEAQKKIKSRFADTGRIAVQRGYCSAGVFWFYSQRRIKEEKKTPEELLTEYMQYMADGDYGAMYGMLDNQSRLNISLEDFEKRNRNIYEGIEASGVRIEIKGTELKEDGTGTVEYQTTMDSLAGEISFFNQAVFWEEVPGEEGTKGKPE